MKKTVKELWEDTTFWSDPKLRAFVIRKARIISDYESSSDKRFWALAELVDRVLPKLAYDIRAGVGLR